MKASVKLMKKKSTFVSKENNEVVEFEQCFLLVEPTDGSRPYRIPVKAVFKNDVGYLRLFAEMEGEDK